MNKFAFALSVTAISLYAASANAGGFGKTSNKIGGNTGVSSGLINISPSVGLGDFNLMNGILSGNVVSGILSGNVVGSGNFNGIGLTGIGSNLIGNNTSYKLNSKHR
jgi:hypothetical protein